MKIISFDVGIKNMAYCIFEIKKDNMPFFIAEWNVVSLLEKEEPHIYCNCISIKAVKSKGKKRNDNGNNNQMIQNCFISNTINSPIPVVPPKLCCRVAKFKKGDSTFCEKHSKTQTEWQIPESRFSQKSLKKMKMEQLINLYFELKIENLPKKRADILKQIENHIGSRFLEPVIEKRCKTADNTDLLSIGKKMKEVFDVVLKNHKDITHVLIENQISPIANRMKTIQGMLAQYFIMVYHSISIEFISSGNKLKLFKNNNESNIIKEKEEVENLTTDEMPTQGQIYKTHKKDGVYYSKLVLEKNAWISSWSTVLETKKKDDLADCFLQGIWYLIKHTKIEMNNEYVIK